MLIGIVALLLAPFASCQVSVNLKTPDSWKSHPLLLHIVEFLADEQSKYTALLSLLALSKSDEYSQSAFLSNDIQLYEAIIEEKNILAIKLPSINMVLNIS
jgi:hypothetical protein